MNSSNICHITTDRFRLAAGGTFTSCTHTSLLKNSRISISPTFLQEPPRHQGAKAAVCGCSHISILHSLCLSLFFSVSKLPPTHSLSLARSLKRMHTATAEHHTLLADYLLQMGRGGLRWRQPQPPLAIYFSTPSYPLTVN